MLSRFRESTVGFPRQYWTLFWGILVNAAGSSIVWPFMTIYLRQRLDISLTTIALLLTLNSAAGLVATSIAGPVVDRFGRKIAMTLSLGMGCVTLVGLSLARTLPAFAVLMAVKGAFDPLYRVGGDSMVADLIEPERRATAYALLRMISNFGVAIGPTIGGFITAVSYDLAFRTAAGTTLLYAAVIVFFIAETVPKRGPQEEYRSIGYGPVLRDRTFLSFCGVYTLAGMAYSLMMVLMPVYIKENFGVPEYRYGFIIATNAIMVVLLQYAVTRVTQRFHHLPVLAAGSLFYALGVGSVGWGRAFPAFLLSMVVLTIGEMIMVPTSTALTANLAPADMRGRYMGVYGLTWGAALGLGPIIGGVLNDRIAPVAIWYSGLAMGLLAAIGFLGMARLRARRAVEPGPAEA